MEAGLGSSLPGGNGPERWPPDGKESLPVLPMAGVRRGGRRSFGSGPSGMCKAAGEEGGQCRSREDLGHGGGGEGRRRVGQCGGPGKDAQGGRRASMGPGTDPSHWVGQDYACSPEQMAVGRHNLGNRKLAHVRLCHCPLTREPCALVTKSSRTCWELRRLVLRGRWGDTVVVAHFWNLCLGVNW